MRVLFCVVRMVRNRGQVITRTDMSRSRWEEEMIHNLQERDKMSRSVITPNNFYGSSYEVLHSTQNSESIKMITVFVRGYVVISNDRHVE